MIWVSLVSLFHGMKVLFVFMEEVMVFGLSIMFGVLGRLIFLLFEGFLLFLDFLLVFGEYFIFLVVVLSFFENHIIVTLDPYSLFKYFENLILKGVFE